MELTAILTFLLALFTTLFVIPNLSHIARRIGLVDHPNERKMHKIPRPLVGGIGIVISATFASLLFVPLGGLRGFFLGMSVLLLVGFFDDFLEVDHRKKFLAQIVATTALMYLSHVSLQNFGNLLGFGEIEVPGNEWVLWGVTVFCVVGVTNALNMIDGLDGLAGGVSFVAFVSFAIMASLSGSSSLMLLNLSFAGAVLGFLRYNWFPSQVFMGDAGALCLGFALSFMAIALTQGDYSRTHPIAVLTVLAIPIADTLVVMSRRIIRRKSPFSPDTSHLHHMLVKAGMSGKRAVLTLLGLSLLFSALAICSVVWSIADTILFALFLVFLTGIVFAEELLKWGNSLIRLAQRRTPSEKCPKIVHSVLKTILGKRFFRGAPRYRVDIAVTCLSYDAETAINGTLRNLSQTGFLAEFDDLGFICKECVISLNWKQDQRGIIDFPAEHLWRKRQDGKEIHGFQFVGLSRSQEDLIRDLLQQLEESEENR